MTSDEIQLPADLRILLGGVPGVTNRGFLGYCTVVLFELEGAKALFDTGHFSDRAVLLEALNQAGLTPDDIQTVILSHLHFDHSLNLPLFKNAQVYVSEAEIKYAEAVSAGRLVDHAIPDHWPRLLEGRGVHLVKDRLELAGDAELRLLPGHTPGCLAMFKRGPRTTAVCGDVVKNAWEAVTGKAAMALAGEEIAGRSIGQVMAGADILIPGHDRAFAHREKEIRFLTPFVFEVRTGLYPEEQNLCVLRLEKNAGEN